MAATTTSNPISDLEYDWVTVLQAKAEGLNAYAKYIKDAEQAGASECVQMFQSMHEQDARQVQQIRDHVTRMLSKSGR